MAVARDVLPAHRELWGSCYAPRGHRSKATEHPERYVVTSPVLCGSSQPPCELVLHPCETMPTNQLQEICTCLEKPRLRTERMSIALGREHDERRGHSRNPLHMDTACLPGIR